ncbi:MAG: hypothetical protein HOW73_08120 [Polyangiaceae bacterium]|nr:hypothetical protein [Polyangiaceae bacterium]
MVILASGSVACEAPLDETSDGGNDSTGQQIATCTIGGVDFEEGELNPAATCQVCDPSNPNVWTTTPSSCLIGGQCYAEEDHDSGLGCTACIPEMSQTDWSPATSCSKLVVAAVNETSQGDLGGLLAANAKCAEEGASTGLPGTWKALLSTSSQDLIDIVSPEDAANPVVNLHAETMFPSWNALFADQTIPNGVNLYRFDDTNNDDLLFTGTNADGTHSKSSCLDWTATGHWGWFHWFNYYMTAGDTETGGSHLFLDRGDDPNCTYFGYFGCVLVPPTDDVDRCPDGFPRGTASDVRLVQAFSPALEGVAVCPNGDVFVSQPETASIFRVALDGSEPELWTTLPGHQPLGMDCASDGVLYVADFGSDDASVFRIAAKNDPGTALPNIPGDGGYHAMNGVAVVDGVGIYATDATNTLTGRIVLFAEQSPNVFEASVVKSGLPFPNDVAFNPATGKLDVTMTVNSQVFSYPVAEDGMLGSRSVTWSGTVALDAIDGLAVAESNDRYIARYLQGKVSRSSDWKTVANMAEPKSLAFRGGTLFITAKTGLYAVDLAVCGAPR